MTLTALTLQASIAFWNNR